MSSITLSINACAMTTIILMAVIIIFYCTGNDCFAEWRVVFARMTIDHSKLETLELLGEGMGLRMCTD